MIIKEDDPKFYDFEPSPTSQGREEMSKEEIIRSYRQTFFNGYERVRWWEEDDVMFVMEQYATQRTEKMREELDEVKLKNALLESDLRSVSEQLDKKDDEVIDLGNELATAKAEVEEWKKANKVLTELQVSLERNVAYEIGKLEDALAASRRELEELKKEIQQILYNDRPNPPLPVELI